MRDRFGRLRTALAALLAASLLAGCGDGEEGSKPLRAHDVSKHVGRLNEEVVRLRERVESALEVQDAQPPAGVEEAERDGRATRGDLQRALDPLRRNLLELSRVLDELTPRESPDPPARSARAEVSRSPEQIRIAIDGPIRNRAVTIRNRGDSTVRNLRLVVNGRRDWYDVDAILRGVTRPEMSDREKAIAIFEFLRDNRRHGYPAHDGVEVHDPVRFLNVYGYGFCDDAATNFMVLAESAGVPARVWGLSGHVVAEAHFDDAWHMFDPDGEIYYVEEDGKTIASVETLQQRPELIRSQPSRVYDAEMLVGIYASTADNEIEESYRKKSEARHTMAISLRPGESLMRSRDAGERFFASRYLDRPQHFGSGRLEFEPIFERELFREGAESASGLRVERLADGAAALVPSASGEPGSLVYRFESPYPFLDGRVTAEAEIEGGARVEAAFSLDGSTWQPIGSLRSSGSAVLSFGDRLPNGYGDPAYAHWLALSASAPPGATLRIRRLHFSSDVQVAPLSLPVLEAGDNDVVYSDETQGERDVEIRFDYDPSRDARLEPVAPNNSSS